MSRFRPGILLCILLLFPLWGQTEDRYVLASGEDLPFSGQSLPAGGLMTQIVQEAITRMGSSSEVHFLPWNQAYRWAESGQALGAFPYVKDRQRLKKFYFSVPLYVTIERFFTPPNSRIRYRDAEDLQGYILCRPLGFSMESVAELIERDVVKLWSPNDLATCFQLLDSGRVHLVPIGELAGRTVAQQEFGNPDYFPVLEKPLQVNGFHLMVVKTYPRAKQILESFNAKVEDMWREGRIQQIYQRHRTVLPDRKMFSLAP